ncbi:MAG: hypothetical protein ACI841_003410 [Planctomycetota bacterium]|jgi:hypothetical protein
MAITLCLILYLAAAPSSAAAALHHAPLAGKQEASTASGEVAKLEAWTERFHVGRRKTSMDQCIKLKELLRAARSQSRKNVAIRNLTVIALVELFAAGASAEVSIDPKRAETGTWLMRLAKQEFQWMRTPDLTRWVISSVLIASSSATPRGRAGAIELLISDPTPELLLGLSTCSRNSDPIVRSAALNALAGWQDESVHRLFARFLADKVPEDQEKKGERASRRAHELGVAERHFSKVRLADNSRATRAVHDWVVNHIGSEDWRASAQALGMTLALGDTIAIPILIDALGLWHERSVEGAPVKRSLHDLAGALGERSGRNLGPHPDRWKRWWEVVQAGGVSTAEIREAAKKGDRTSATFYGLRPESDRVVFVIDRSTSMSWGRYGEDSAGPSRYEQAVDQMLAFVGAMGPQARFNIILFSNRSLVWRPSLQPAKSTHLREARSWLNSHKPNGATNLRQSIELAFQIDKKGQPVLEKLEADTLIVLCDGQTALHSGDWVAPFFARVLPPTRMIVHAVQIGGVGDGTLEALAAQSGGNFVLAD